MRVAPGWQSTAGAPGPEDCRRQQSETSYRPEAPLRQQLTRIPRGPADSNDGARHRATHSKALHPRAPPERHRAGPQGNRADRRFVWRSAWNALVLPYSIQCHPHRGGRRIYACVDKILLHTSARFDQSKAIRWRGWGRLASAFRELPWNFGPCFHTTFAELANAFIRLGRFDEAVAAARKSLRKSQTYTGAYQGADSTKTRSASAHIRLRKCPFCGADRKRSASDQNDANDPQRTCGHQITDVIFRPAPNP